MTRLTRLVFAALAVCLAPSASAQLLSDGVQAKVVLSDAYHIDRKYRSMEGPQSTQNVMLVESEIPELLWLTGVRTEMVGEDGDGAALPEFMCHVNVDYDAARHRAIFGWAKNVSPRLVTLSQGQLESYFPPGFGIPIMSNEPIMLTTQVLNLNYAQPDLYVRHKVTFYFARECDLALPMRPLYNSGVFGMALVEATNGLPAMKLPESGNGASCLMRPRAPNAMGGSEYRDSQGRLFTGHWVVKPGREENRTDVTEQLGLLFDTMLHHAAVHLHPYAESLELRDATADKSLFKAVAKGPEHGAGLTEVSSFASESGIPLIKGHQYELVSVYNNTTGADADSMAVMYLGLLDREFRRPDPATGTVPLRTSAEQIHLVFETVAGNIGVALYPLVAPQTVTQFVRLVRAGVYDGVRFVRLEPGFVLQTAVATDRSTPLTPEQLTMIRTLPLEPSAAPHRRGTLSLAHYDGDPDGGETSFSILLGDAPHLDGNFTVFGMVESGWDALDTIEHAPIRNNSSEPAVDIRIRRARVVGDGER